MSELDAFFGTKEVGHITTHVGRTNWPRQPEHLRPILDVFQSKIGRNPRGLESIWAAGARKWHAVFGEGTYLLSAAMDVMEARNLSVSSPASCITVALELQEDGEGQSKQDYFRELARKLDAAADLEVDEED